MEDGHKGQKDKASESFEMWLINAQEWGITSSSTSSRKVILDAMIDLFPREQGTVSLKTSEEKSLSISS